jgi:pimeloyl-ACP methyl ester carboxylesterase
LDREILGDICGKDFIILETHVAPRIFALLAGVNDYTPNVGKLHGCLNDVDRYRDFLKSHFDESRLAIEVRKDSDATREGIIDGFRSHLSQAGPNDVALFQFSGHGARWKSAKEFNAFYPDGYDEGLVCWDSRREPDKPGSYDLSDKELAVLVSEVASKNPHLTVILDCCHSGSGTRSADHVAQLAVRLSHQIDQSRPLDSYLGGHYSKMLDQGLRLETPASKHILLAACERKKQAFEGYDRCGIFTSTLMEMLEKCKGNATYAELFVRIRAIVRRKAYNQTPQFETFLGFNGHGGFLGGEVLRSTKTRFIVGFDKKAKSWVADCGAINGIVTEQNKQVEFSIYGDKDDKEPIGSSKGTDVGLVKTKVDFEFEAKKSDHYFAEVTSLPAPPLNVSVDGNAEGIESIKEFQNSNVGLNDVQLVDDEDLNLEYRLSAEKHREHGDCLMLKHTATNRLVQGVKGFSDLSAERMFKTIGHVAYWERMLALQNHSCEADPAMVPFRFVETPIAGDETSHTDSKFSFDVDVEKKEFVRGKFVVKNQTQQELYVMLVYFSENYQMTVLDIDELPPVDAWKTLRTFKGKPNFRLGLSKNCPNMSTERFMLIVSKEPIDDFLLGPPDQRDSAGSENTVLSPIDIGQIVDPTKQRLAMEDCGQIQEVDWFTKTIEFELSKKACTLSSNGDSSPTSQIKIHSHPEFQANVVMGSVSIGGRNAESGAGFCQGLEANGLSLVNFSNARGDALNAVELTEIQNSESLKDNPLKITIDANLAEGECLLPVAFDGEHIIPVGETHRDEQGAAHLSIDHIPEMPDNRRSVFSSLKLYFFKTYMKLEKVNQLRQAVFDEQGNAKLDGSDLAQKVADAKQVTVLLHGILGDGESIASSIHPQTVGSDFSLPVWPDGKISQDHLVLVYDYENISTPLEKTASELKAALQKIGIDKSYDKPVALVGYSIGGLVARWLTEQEGGKEFVKNVFLIGVPNDGSPIGKIGPASRILKLLTTVALNSIPALAGICSAVLSGIVGVNKFTGVLEQLDKNSEFLTKLNQAPDPSVQYTILTGSVDSIAQPDAWLDKLIKKLGATDLMSTIFQDEPHDLVVSVGSARNISRSRSPEPMVHNIGCHHLNYFHSNTGDPIAKS